MCSLCCLFAGVLPISITPLKKSREHLYSNATQRGRLLNGNLNPPPSSSRTPPPSSSLLSLTTTYGIVALIGLHFAAAPTTLPSSRSLFLAVLILLMGQESSLIGINVSRKEGSLCCRPYGTWVPLTPALPWTVLKTQSKSAIHCRAMVIMNGTL